ncbi:hypothetical protein RCL_jg11159.t1 [Rhizophagus clarus]|uniref:Uncharacterized protein n=1 Tax=Rhizophagus clarus TaxID=94130 RepID=A0A8H3R318_9GLOM|nr:hypothetical protein RCL_jg11159.t1 [Rhizophagus clarus]
MSSGDWHKYDDHLKSLITESLVRSGDLQLGRFLLSHMHRTMNMSVYSCAIKWADHAKFTQSSRIKLRKIRKMAEHISLNVLVVPHELNGRNAFSKCEEMHLYELISRHFPQPRGGIFAIFMYSSPSEDEDDILRMCVEMLGKVIEELKREILVFIHKTRYAGVVVSDSEDDESNSEEDDETDSDEVESGDQRSRFFV